jgi:hypothetical protein
MGLDQETVAHRGCKALVLNICVGYSSSNRSNIKDFLIAKNGFGVGSPQPLQSLAENLPTNQSWYSHNLRDLDQTSRQWWPGWLIIYLPIRSSSFSHSLTTFSPHAKRACKAFGLFFCNRLQRLSFDNGKERQWNYTIPYRLGLECRILSGGAS